jgi:hypothetical protein
MSQKTISLSKYIGVSRKKLEEVGIFDSTLGIDTKLFVDPKLLVDADIAEFKDAREKIISYFRELLRWHKQSGKSPRIQDKVRSMLAVPEPPGLSIGYGNKTDRGTAIPTTLANAILLSASELLAIGIDEPEVLEVLALFVPNFGPDRLSDLTASIVYPNFCAYTARLSSEFGIKTCELEIDGTKYQLPKHPFLNAPVIFIPADFLRPLPVATSWDEIAAAAQHNESLREDFNKIIYPALVEQMEKINKASKKEKAEMKKEFDALLKVYKDIEVRPYDLDADERGYYAVQPFVDEEAKRIPKIKQPSDRKSLLRSLRTLLEQYQRAIEENGGNKLLYKKDKKGDVVIHRPHHEDVAQIIFYLLADQFCQVVNIALARESNAGLGPVDFWLASSYDTKVLVEVKKSTNKSLVDGFNKQVQAYEKSENAFHSFYVVIIVKDRKKNRDGDYTDQLEQLERQFEDRQKNKKLTPELIVIDGLMYPSPSKL